MGSKRKPPSKTRKGRILNVEKIAINAYRAQGLSIKKIADKMGRSIGAVNYIIKDAELKELQDSYDVPVMQAMIQQIEKNELNDLAMLGAKARRNLHELADAGEMKPIENIALMDRSFQQKRLLQGKSTSNINSLSYLITKAAEAREKRAMGITINMNMEGGVSHHGSQANGTGGEAGQKEGIDKQQNKDQQDQA